jgi:hypothetical protein
MRKIAAFIVAAMPLDDFGRRVVAETLADWDHAEGEAASSTRRAFETLRGMAAVTGAVMRLSAREVSGADAWISINEDSRARRGPFTGRRGSPNPLAAALHAHS